MFKYLFLFIANFLFASELSWLNDYNEALSVAKKEKKDIYLFVGADECRWCDYFKEKTLSKADVIQKLKLEYVPLYLSRDRHFIPKEFETKGVPRHYFLKPDGTIYYKDQGSREVDGFFQMLDEAELKRVD